MGMSIRNQFFVDVAALGEVVVRAMKEIGLEECSEDKSTAHQWGVRNVRGREDAVRGISAPLHIGVSTHFMLTHKQPPMSLDCDAREPTHTQAETHTHYTSAPSTTTQQTTITINDSSKGIGLSRQWSMW